MNFSTNTNGTTPVTSEVIKNDTSAIVTTTMYCYVAGDYSYAEQPLQLPETMIQSCTDSQLLISDVRLKVKTFL